MTRNFCLSIMPMLLVLSACGSFGVQVTNTPTPTATRTPLPTYTETPTVTLTMTPIPTTTLTPIPADITEAIYQLYTGLVYVQFEANLVNDTASKVVSGELLGFDIYQAVIGCVDVVNGVDNGIAPIRPLPLLTDRWKEGLFVHGKVKDTLNLWFNQKTLAPDVIGVIKPLLTYIEITLTKTDDIVSSQYGINKDYLAKTRQDALNTIQILYTTKTPTPKN